jgi:hypothetical protein
MLRDLQLHNPVAKVYRLDAWKVRIGVSYSIIALGQKRA